MRRRRYGRVARHPPNSFLPMNFSLCARSTAFATRRAVLLLAACAAARRRRSGAGDADVAHDADDHRTARHSAQPHGIGHVVAARLIRHARAACHVGQVDGDAPRRGVPAVRQPAWAARRSAGRVHRLGNAHGHATRRIGSAALARHDERGGVEHRSARISAAVTDGRVVSRDRATWIVSIRTTCSWN